MNSSPYITVKEFAQAVGEPPFVVYRVWRHGFLRGERNERSSTLWLHRSEVALWPEIRAKLAQLPNHKPIRC